MLYNHLSSLTCAKDDLKPTDAVDIKILDYLHFGEIVFSSKAAETHF